MSAAVVDVVEVEPREPVERGIASTPCDRTVDPPSGGARVVPQTSKAWCAYFRTNERRLLGVPWERGAELMPEEKAAIAESVQGFQLGESSEGKHLIHCAIIHAARIGDPDYVTAIRHLIREEQRHAIDIARRGEK